MLHDLPNNFFQLVQSLIPFQLYPYQLEDLKVELEDILEGKGNFLTRERARQTGKTISIASVSLVCMILIHELSKLDSFCAKYPHAKNFRLGFNVGIVGPKIDQARITLKRLKKFARQEPFIKTLQSLKIKITASNYDYFELSNGSSMRALSGSPLSNNEGESFHLLVFDEAQKLSQFAVHKMFAPSVASTNGTMLAYGTAWTSQGPFLNQIERNKSKAPECHSSIPYNIAMQYSSDYKSWVLKEIERIGEFSTEVRLNLKLEWILASGNAMTIDLWEDTDMLGDYDPGQTSGGTLHAGVDWGKNDSSTIVTIIEKLSNHCRWIDFLDLQGDDYPSQHIQIQKFLNSYRTNLKSIWSESTGIGDTNTDFLMGAFPHLVTPVTAYNLWVLHDKLLYELKSKRLIRPRRKEKGVWSILSSQILNVQKSYKGSCVVLRAEKGEHEDYIDSSALCLGGALSTPIVSFNFVSSKLGNRVAPVETSRVMASNEKFARKTTNKVMSRF